MIALGESHEHRGFMCFSKKMRERERQKKKKKDIVFTKFICMRQPHPQNRIKIKDKDEKGQTIYMI
jgi:hypothetical protein